MSILIYVPGEVDYNELITVGAYQVQAPSAPTVQRVVEADGSVTVTVRRGSSPGQWRAGIYLDTPDLGQGYHSVTTGNFAPPSYTFLSGLFGDQRYRAWDMTPDRANEGVGLTNVTINYTVRWQASVPDVDESPIVENPESVLAWGPRTLDYPLWFAATAQQALQERIDALAEPRAYQTVDFALSQPDAQRTADVAGIQPGDYIGLSIDDPATRVNINAIVYVMLVKYVLDRNRVLSKRLLCLQSGDGLAHASITLAINSRVLSINDIELAISG